MQIPPIGEKNRSNEGFLCSKIFSVYDEKASLTIQHRQTDGTVLNEFVQNFRKYMNLEIPLLKMKDHYLTDGNGIVYFDSEKDPEFIKEIKKEDSICVAYKNLTVLKYDWLIGSTRTNNMKYKLNEINKGEDVFFNSFYKWEDVTFYTTDDVKVMDITKNQSGDFLGVSYGFTEMELKDEKGDDYKVRVSNGYNETLKPIYRAKLKALKNAISNDEKAKINTDYANFKNSFAKLKRNTAITSHKAQGSTYNTVIVPVNDFANKNHKDANQLLYVAISRAKKKIIFVNNDDIYEKGGRKILTEASKNAIASRDGYKCQMCGDEKEDIREFEVDHKTPLKKGGTNSANNLQILCKKCHKAKTKRDI